MEFIAVLILTVAAVFALRNAIRRAPTLFYLAAAALVALQLSELSGLLGAWWKPLLLLTQRCMLALSLFVIVMFIGTLPKESRVGKWLRPIRGELSILACILCTGHILSYIAPYTIRAISCAMSGSMLASFVTAMVLVILLAILGTTSLETVKRRMNATSWKKLQRWAYVFFALIFLHLLLMLLPSALKGAKQAMESLVVYSALFIAYVALRTIKAVADKRFASKTASGKEQSAAV